MTDGGTVIDAASAGVEGLAGAALSGLGQAGPVGELARPVVTALRNVWEGYFGAPVPEGGTNWSAYTHDQLYRMLWDSADVGDVSTVAAEWQRHGSGMREHSDSLRAEQGSLRESWSGPAADRASGRLGTMGEHSSGVGDRASTVGHATQQAGDALAVARNTMPPPPGDPTGGAVAAASAGAGAGAVIGGVLGAGAGGIGAAPGALMGAAIGAVAGGGASLFLANVAAAERKAEAVHVMERYETSLHDSSHAIDPAAGGSAVSGADDATTAAGYAGPTGGGLSGGGAPWSALTTAAPVGSGLSAGLRSALGMEGALLARNAAMAEMAAARAASGNGMMPGSRGGAREEEEEVHQNKMPVLDQPLLAPDELTSRPVIGL
ncbi:WXG100 family type VII secretion target [Amycolatopsis jiangsuensis]|uniref:PPE family protein n=1 Tax=Amycolatopsis jiangsuensis TaxID=1181879 RepID=A0A840J094_9PSEU|nr:hypothetical protein [Amycolatopsis jiangsuensis]MBB4688366.1 hypothetical protein [Amycolatopsis jiangsuensis]